MFAKLVVRPLRKVSSLSSPLNRHLRLLPEDLSGLSTPGQCLTARHAVGVARPGLAHAECSGSHLVLKRGVEFFFVLFRATVCL